MQSIAAVNRLEKREPMTRPIRKIAKIGIIMDEISDGKVFMYTVLYIMKKVMMIQSMQTNNVRNRVRVPPILKNLCLFLEKIYVEI